MERSPGADVMVAETFHIQRYVGMPLENRGVVAVWDRRDGTMTTWNSTQVSHFVQQGLTGVLGLPPHKIRVIAPDLGGGFGTKASGYAEGPGTASAASVTRTRATSTIERLPIGGLLRDQRCGSENSARFRPRKAAASHRSTLYGFALDDATITHSVETMGV